MTEKIEAVLTKAENELQEIIVEAAKAGDYRGVDAGRAAAVEICNLKARILKPSSKSDLKSESNVSRDKKKVATKRHSRGKYPKFEVKNDTLVRIGWSKKERREYTHKVPKRVFYETVEVMSRLAQGGTGPFLAENIIEQVNNAKSETIPSYQIYVVIGFLRKLNCIKQIGREGYDIPTDLSTRAKKECDNLSL
ncbi:MAG: hypothetical protein ACYSUY_14855 [Planctomycetota bacterium]